MPLITVSMRPGRAAGQKGRFAAAVTEPAVSIPGAGGPRAIMVLEENGRENWHQGGRHL